MHKILAGTCTAEALRVIFRGDPPENEGPTGYDVEVPESWQVLLDDALREGVLNDEQASLWGKAFIRAEVDTALFLGMDLPESNTT